ncbi:MAG TPA: aminoglycoside adenylyltransferase domain-containing protein, partial [Actinomycetota bacterium]
ASACSHRMLPCPARKLELVLYPLEAVRSAPPSLDWLLNLETGAAGEDVSFDPASQPRHWFVLDAAIARDHARPVIGPPAGEVFAPLDRDRVIEALRDSIAWHREHDPGSANAVLNACRGWAWTRTGAWMSKPDAARWAAERTSYASLVRSALAIHGGASGEPLSPEAADAFVAEAERGLMGSGG